MIFYHHFRREDSGNWLQITVNVLFSPCFQTLILQSWNQSTGQNFPCCFTAAMILQLLSFFYFLITCVWFVYVYVSALVYLVVQSPRKSSQERQVTGTIILFLECSFCIRAFWFCPLCNLSPELYCHRNNWKTCRCVLQSRLLGCEMWKWLKALGSRSSTSEVEFPGSRQNCLVWT